MSEYVIISARVKRELLEEAKRLNINISELIRNALENEVRRRRLAILEERLKQKRDVLAGMDVSEMVELIREDREVEH
ncbi:MAG: type II toxin-antitoxin system CcdA family antitoxin [Desulfurococcus sp.]|nr:type II toxin-antitoxin system CcdA family antitoxin [Desulfurococcus sp.]